MGESRTAWWLRVIAIVAVLAGTASAQRSRKPEAEVLFKQGKAAMTAGDLTTACTKFESSNALDARASTMMNLGACYEAQGKVVSAWYAFDEASRLAARKDDEAGLVTPASDKAKALAARRSSIEIVVAPEARVAGLTITRNDEPMVEGQWNSPVFVDGGEYTIVARAAGTEAWTARVAVASERDQSRVEIPKLRVTPPVVTPPPPDVTPPPDPAPTVVPPIDLPADRPVAVVPGRFTPLRIVGVGVGVVGLAALGGGIFYGLKANDREAAADALCSTSVCDDPDGIRLNEEAQDAASTSNLLLIGGGVAVVAGAVLWFVGAPASGGAQVAVRPRLSADQVGLTITGGSEMRGSIVLVAGLAAVLTAGCSVDDKRAGTVDAAAVDASAPDGPIVDAAVDASLDAPGAAALSWSVATYGTMPPTVLIDGGTGVATMILTNTGTGPVSGLTFTAVPTGGAFAITPRAECAGTLMPQDVCHVDVTFDPSTVGPTSKQVTVNAAPNLAATATVSGTGGARVQLTITNVAVGTSTTTGRVTSSPAGIDCGAGMTQCEAVFTTAPVTLTAIDTVGTLSDWGVPACGVAAPCVLPLITSSTITTTFHAPWTYTMAGSNDQAEGVAFDPAGGSVVVGGFRSNVGLLLRLDGATGVFGSETTLAGAPVRRVLDVAVAASGSVAEVGEWNAVGNYDGVKSERSADFAVQSGLQNFGDTPAERLTGVCFDGSNRVHAIGVTDPGVNMIWGRWPAQSGTSDYLHNSPTAARPGTGLDIACTADTAWVVGASSGMGWIGRIDPSGNAGTIAIEQAVAGTTHAGGVATFGTGVVVSGHNGTTEVVRRYDATLGVLWTQTFSGVASGSAVAVDPVGGIVYAAFTDANGCTLRQLDGATGNVAWTRSGIAAACFDLAANADGVAVAGYVGTAARALWVRKYFH